MTNDPVELRVDRIRDRMTEITLQLASLDKQADTDREDSGEQAELLAKVTELRDEHRVLEERLSELLQSGPIADDPNQADSG